MVVIHREVTLPELIGSARAITHDSGYLWITSSDNKVVVQLSTDGTFIRSIDVSQYSDYLVAVTTNGKNLIFEDYTFNLLYITDKNLKLMRTSVQLETDRHFFGIICAGRTLWAYNYSLYFKLFAFDFAGKFLYSVSLGMGVQQLHDITEYKNHLVIIQKDIPALYFFGVDGHVFRIVDLSPIDAGCRGVTFDGRFFWIVSTNHRKLYQISI